MPFYVALTQNVFSVLLLSFSRYLAYIKARLTYVGIENVLEWSCYITAIIFVIDFSECHAETGLRYGWQWQVGAVSITITWLNLLSNVRKFPFLGIYVVMFSDVMITFLKFSIICALFLIAFSLGFHVLLAEQVRSRRQINKIVG